MIQESNKDQTEAEPLPFESRCLCAYFQFVCLHFQRRDHRSVRSSLMHCTQYSLYAYNEAPVYLWYTVQVNECPLRQYIKKRTLSQMISYASSVPRSSSCQINAPSPSSPPGFLIYPLPLCLIPMNFLFFWFRLLYFQRSFSSAFSHARTLHPFHFIVLNRLFFLLLHALFLLSTCLCPHFAEQRHSGRGMNAAWT